MNRRTESERFSGPARQMDQNCRRHSQSYLEDDFGADNAAGHKISRLNTEAFFRRFYMQNKPNLRNDKMNVTSVLTMHYEDFRLCRRPKNKPNQTQFQTCFLRP